MALQAPLRGRVHRAEHRGAAPAFRTIPVRRNVQANSSHAKFFVGGNWKANGTLDSVTMLCQDLNKGADSFDTQNVDVVVAPTHVHLSTVKTLLDTRHYHISAQNVWLKGTGAFTGEIPAEILKDMGIMWTLTGHSERRTLCGETNEIVGLKTARALELGMSVIPCIGETLEQRNSGQLFKVLEAQVQALVDHVKDWSRIVVAYEPVWAIGTGVVATPAQAQEVHAYLRSLFNEKLGPKTADTLRIIYGGSVTAENCEELAGQSDIDGFLVGGASLKGGAFLKIVSAYKAKKGVAV
mmetsp:Transcript_28263/g.72058  ORF Transcript_28263/g.72058 Transcript_28263/m.72058 type:complete len:296 (-) Transcript_28263:147-1034(-)|eukprot:CAMPEP_0202865064 /NCGR_PEP_ID=MMETSP1391-20130828/5179_1 /ASSEMBLY_ACC=CAM_ASM_000867 /TAXON_ID=1034604 /ORGANISM="Chlamydomonas leiostraca, Strain SAG 11-49" /LENGTH=295 /DNA_ID=CAMNT_0049544859 /DNA_START=20 /DNA_END=907 /DNA_ORIENTATION=+